MLFARAKKPAWYALSESGGQAVIARLQRTPGEAPRLLQLSREALPVPGAGRAGLKRAHHLERYRGLTLLPHDSYRFLKTETPDVPETELAEAMRWRIKDQLDYPVEEAAIQVLPIPADPAPGRQASAFVVAARTEAVRDLVQDFQKDGLPLDVIDVRELAQRNLAHLFEEPERGLATLSVTPEGSLLTLTANGELYALRQIDIPLAALRDPDASRRTELFDRLTLELQRSLDSFDRQHGQIPVARLVLLPMPDSDELHRYLVENLYLPVVAVDLADVLDASAIPDFRSAEAQNQGLFAICLALREVGA